MAPPPPPPHPVFEPWSKWLVAFTNGFGETDDDGLLARQLGKGLYRIRRRDCQRMTPPYMDYWRKAA